LSWKSSPNNRKNSSNNNNNNASSKRGGSLTIVGSGIQTVRQFTLESRQAIEQAESPVSIPDPIYEIGSKR
jgi:hypothetical protein